MLRRPESAKTGLSQLRQAGSFDQVNLYLVSLPKVSSIAKEAVPYWKPPTSIPNAILSKTRYSKARRFTYTIHPVAGVV